MDEQKNETPEVVEEAPVEGEEAPKEGEEATTKEDAPEATDVAEKVAE